MLTTSDLDHTPTCNSLFFEISRTNLQNPKRCRPNLDEARRRVTSYSERSDLALLLPLSQDKETSYE